jgi:murein DD-endopeptidase MepM/ murein hydrolase activator NlpD
VFADQASAVAYASAAALPDPEELAAALEGWQTDLLDYEAELRSELGDDATDEEIEERLDELFRPQTFAGRIDAPAPPPPVAPPAEAPVPAPAPPEQPAAAPAPEPPAPEAPVVEEPVEPASAAPTPIVVAFQPHPAFYRCPVIEVANAGPTADDRTLTEYTPWIETPAGVLIRAPVAGACLSSGYGPRTVDGASRNHGGVDFHNRDGGAIFAAGDGVVLEAGEDEAYGHAVRIDHGNGVEGHYAHMVAGSLKVRAGDRVTLGDEIGVMGRTGRAYAVHLHYELRFQGETVDPLYTGKRAGF